MKKHLIISIYIFVVLVVLASAGLVNKFDITNVKYENKIKTNVDTVDLITYECNGIIVNVNVTEPNGDYDENDIESITKNCKGNVTNIKKGNLIFKQNKYGFKSFDETELIKDECGKSGNYWDDKNNECNDEPILSKDFNEELYSMSLKLMYECDSDVRDSVECIGGLSGGKGTRCYQTIEKNEWFYCSSGWYKI